MYQAVYAKNGQLKHSGQCNMAFGRKDEKCPRCVEMMNGASPRSGWQKGYYENKKRDEENRLESIRNHDCVKSRCGYVCTAFEW